MLSRLLNFRHEGPGAGSPPQPALPVSVTASGPSSALGGKRFETRAPDHRNAIELLDGLWITDFSFVNPDWGGGAFDWDWGGGALETGPRSSVRSQPARPASVAAAATAARVRSFMVCSFR